MKFNEALRRFLDPPEFGAFVNPTLPHSMRMAFGACVGPIHAIPVVGDDSGGGYERYVLEVDVTPHSAICGDLRFSY